MIEKMHVVAQLARSRVARAHSWRGRVRVRARAVAPVFALFGAMAILGGTSGCGASFQTVYESEAQFEHCYAIDDRAGIAAEKRSACWKEWLALYAKGQPRDRIQYARKRYAALSQAPHMPTDEAMMAAAGGAPHTEHVAPAPKSAFKPPPSTDQDDDDADVDPRNQAPAATVRHRTVLQSSTSTTATTQSSTSSALKPGTVAADLTDCVVGCAREWSECQSRCHSNDCARCDADQRACVVGCRRGSSPAAGSSAAIDGGKR